MMFGWDDDDDTAANENQTSSRVRLIAIIACVPVLAGLALIAFFIVSQLQSASLPTLLAQRP